MKKILVGYNHHLGPQYIKSWIPPGLDLEHHTSLRSDAHNIAPFKPQIKSQKQIKLIYEEDYIRCLYYACVVAIMASEDII